jgi:hypothetical protein
MFSTRDSNIMPRITKPDNDDDLIPYAEERIYLGDNVFILSFMEDLREYVTANWDKMRTASSLKPVDDLFNLLECFRRHGVDIESILANVVEDIE